jgi:hypothetical protein
MMINMIHPYQGHQNAVRPGGSNATSVESKPVVSDSRSETPLLSEMDAPEALMLGIKERVNALQEKLDLNLVQYPPFFPIATYQRMDLIGEIRNIQVDIEKSSLSSGIKQSISGNKLKDDATDDQIADVLDKVLALRDTLKQKLTVSLKDIQPGVILKLEA